MNQTTQTHIRQLLSQVTDPEIPVLTIEDMGILRDIDLKDDGTVEVIITPTYSGCPAMHAIEKEISKTLAAHGYKKVVIKEKLSPPWTTDWMTDEARAKLEAYGISPPSKGTPDKRVLFGKQSAVRCPHCKSLHTEMVSQFGSTACKALYRCLDCLEPFDYFKCI
ncbi:1,2-phenylacetyl-CoA epoxidase subunit PaaD [Schleiferia thermophila]|jgi:ring-1,2-phenylacetyl-CoA epoxidase subunit PaaD|uniref:1,2-phenylacetyl-CoA epoxidase subunit PaaD n=1 Tax=Schleiferia thermophila TaxID=884107 RepID=UPI0004E6D643|nr:1,2-phenylacetyl-CoA epoxidase subunit PaaD [Schleiferia thermophila]KFD39547.1 phenylacetate-CoA oxygenase subunit PaaJ [Schleiferia thermophila str. Yellowstone]PMB38127.1 phenylacetate-CoA oxygenase subunit PaaJ [Fischerella thermalis CCMEE 5319]